MKIKTSELNGLALDWAVANCEGHSVTVLTVEEQRARWFEHVDPESMERERAAFQQYIADTLRPVLCVRGDNDYKRRPTHKEAPMLWGFGQPTFEYSKSWAQGGPIIEREKLNLEPFTDINGDQWCVDGQWNSPTPLIAAMRCFVARKMGDEVEVTDELCRE